MERAQELLKQKSALESEIRQLESDPRAHGVDRTTPLVDSSGFPRSDIDIVAIRTTRQSLICKQNDLKALMLQIEAQLVSLHQDSAPTPKPAEAKKRPFARVSIVTPSSPASEAGLLAGDKIIQYGSVDASNHDNFRAMSTETINNINKPLLVTIERVVNGQPEVMELTLHLRHGWGGESLLGCHILPLQM
ncbi:putative 26S proteasome regulatory subunit [Coemansia sp. RSA 2706]|nr:putative 26S proteasome regulatory subunit [Coemansia sp. RSA 2706]KAJ2321970.1 putative 26S proteasome regulatory subunit [Coemansia sp. RSA 2704]KAJ2328851.1 putative 26S proteasome regulatory subunit [Coemansia sp. RSA 2702]KAJ2369421.1 putative 26S proteasome regulatory subunit [Coemansia sp. RSA 2610]KAJ2393178.1 putative 26S proteasome regulatory subunit [Coemansia sp. RSA 2611]KAJ2739747.1 putative 26S proteasome regulatory subunit [Coemansia sp. Cherry 401B]